MSNESTEESTEEWRKRIANDKRDDQTRYTFEDAACAVQIISTEPFEPALDMMLDAARSGKLPFYDAGNNIRCKHKFIKPKERHHEVYWKHVVGLFVKNEPPIYLESKRYLGGVRPRCVEILSWLIANGYDPLNLPAPKKKGLPTVKVTCKKVLCKNKAMFSSEPLFDKAWQQLLDNDEMKWGELPT